MDPLLDDQAIQNTPSESSVRGSKKKNSPSGGLISYVVFALGIALFIRFFIATPYVVDGASMQPTFHTWEYLIVDKVVYDIADPKRGDVIVFILPTDQDRSLIKRVIGLPGDTVRISNSIVTIFNENSPEGFTLAEPYVDPSNATGGEYMEITLGAEEYFVLGDNRNVSSDSRVWGKLPKANVTGRVDARLFPLTEIGVLPGKARYSSDITSSEN